MLEENFVNKGKAGGLAKAGSGGKPSHCSNKFSDCVDAFVQSSFFIRQQRKFNDLFDAAPSENDWDTNEITANSIL